ncbi:MAG: VanZ family protein [Gemmatimonadota bacterium]|nr:VanZ family protein [Gemmatimonadota bacterium]
MLRELYYEFLPYRSMFAPFLTLSAIAVPCWLLVRLDRLRDNGHRLSVTREIVLLTFVVYLAGLASATLLPNRSDRLLAAGRGGVDLRPNRGSLTCSPALLPEGSSRGFCVRNARGNVALYFPLGVLLPLVWMRLRFWWGVLIVFVVSFSIELVQYFSSAWGSYRAADVNDLILNVFGGCFGLAVVFLLRWRPGPTRQPGY